MPWAPNQEFRSTAPLSPQSLHVCEKTRTHTRQSITVDSKHTELFKAVDYEQNPYLSKLLRLKELRSFGGESSVLMGSEKIPRANSIRRNTESTKSMDSRSANVDNFLPWKRAYLPFAIVNPNPNSRAVNEAINFPNFGSFCDCLRCGNMSIELTWIAHFKSDGLYIQVFQKCRGQLME